MEGCLGKKKRRSVGRCLARRWGCVQPEEPRMIRHQFRLYYFRRPHTCFVCKQLVYNQGSACQVCRYICHRRCEMQVMTTCVPQVSNDLSNETLNKSQSERSVGQSSQGSRGIMSSLRDMLNRSHDGTGPEELLLDMTYVTERIISMSFPSEGHDTTYAFNLKEVVRMLKTKHSDNYLILNLSEKRQDLVKANPQVKDYGWPDHLAPPLERLCSVCKAVDAWLHADPRNVAVLHCKGGRARLAIVIAAYMHYSNICASADQALDRFAMKRFYEDKLGGLPLPSQRRYLHYFAGLLSGTIKINTNPLYLHHILIHGVPNFDTRGGCRPFIKVYQGMQPIFMSGVYNVTDNMQKVCISISPGIPLRGDILLKCYHKKVRTGQREVMWQCQFHTCAVQIGNVVYSKQELDDAIHDPRFPDNGKVEFVFGPSSDVAVSVSGFKSDVTVPVDDNEENLTRSDSYENFYKGIGGASLEKNANLSAAVPAVNGVSAQQKVPAPVQHTQGPKDGSLYATVNKGNKQADQVDSGLPPHNGPSHLPNGSLTSSVDSGYAGPRDTSYGSHHQHHHQQQQQQQQQQIAEQVSSQVSSSRGTLSSGTLTRSPGGPAEDPLTYNSLPPQPKPAPTVDERSQLDELLSDLLSESASITSPKSPSSRSPSGPRSPLSPASPQQQQQQTGANAMTTTTQHSYSSFSRTDGVGGGGVGGGGGGIRSPPMDPMMVQRTDLSYRSVGGGHVEDRPQYHGVGDHPPGSAQSRIPRGGFTYTPTPAPTSPPAAQGDRSQHATLEREVRVDHSAALQQQQQGGPPSHTQTLPYRTDYENRYPQDGQRYGSLDGGGDLTWLQQQQQKLRCMREGRDATGRTQQEKQLVNELKVAQNRYFRQRAHSDAEEQAMMDSYHQPQVHNGPFSPSPASAPIVPVAYTPPPPREFGGETGHFNTFSHQQSSHYETQSQFTGGSGGVIVGGGGERASTKPPPSPTMQRSVQHQQHQQASLSSVPVQPPVRSSSKDYMRSRSQSSSSSTWQPSASPTPPPPSVGRPLVRQYSETLYDREQRLAAQHAPSSQSTPPLSPRALSPSSQGGGPPTTYTTYRTIHKEVHDEHRARPAQQQQHVVTVPVVHSQSAQHQHQQHQQHQHHQQQQQQQAPGSQQKQHNYITEVFVHRVGGEKSGTDKADRGAVEDTRLDELTRSLQAATDSIMEEHMSHSQQHQQQQHQHQPQMAVQQQPQQMMQQQQQQQQHQWQEHYQTVSSVMTRPPPSQLPVTPGMTPSTVDPACREATSASLVSPVWDNSLPYSSVVKSHQEAAAPRAVGVVEEDRFMLKPIGPGMQTLEPDAPHPSTGTLTRSPITPSFPTSPGSSGVVSPMGTLSGQSMVQQQQQYVQQQQYQQYVQQQQQQQQQQAQIQQQQLQQQQPQIQQQQQVQQQQHQFQQHQQHQQQHQLSDGSLHIDTSHRMLSPAAQARSPSSAGSPSSPSNLNTLRQELSAAHSVSGSAGHSHSLTGQSSPSVYFGLSRRGSLSSLADSDMIPNPPKFVKDTSKFWYKPNISREEAIKLLKDRSPGSFIIRDSNSFHGAFGLAIKVNQVPTNVATKPSGDPQADLVRHFLIEPTTKGVRLRGCNNEPTFGSLAALVYQHSITPLALPCKLILPEAGDAVDGPVSPDAASPELNSAADLLAKGAACNVVYINTVDTESLTGPQAIAQAIKATIEAQPAPKTTIVHFKVSSQGITLTDNNRKLFFRRHYPVSSVTYCGTDAQDRRWKRDTDTPGVQVDAKIFGFVARKQGGVSDNSCHLFAELDPEQPASAIVNFVTKVMIGQSKGKP